jgi:hypothetical protein
MLLKQVLDGKSSQFAADAVRPQFTKAAILA